MKRGRLELVNVELDAAALSALVLPRSDGPSGPSPRLDLVACRAARLVLDVPWGAVTGDKGDGAAGSARRLGRPVHIHLEGLSMTLGAGALPPAAAKQPTATASALSGGDAATASGGPEAAGWTEWALAGAASTLGAAGRAATQATGAAALGGAATRAARDALLAADATATDVTIVLIDTSGAEDPAELVVRLPSVALVVPRGGPAGGAGGAAPGASAPAAPVAGRDLVACGAEVSARAAPDAAAPPPAWAGDALALSLAEPVAAMGVGAEAPRPPEPTLLRLVALRAALPPPRPPPGPAVAAAAGAAPLLAARAAEATGTLSAVGALLRFRELAFPSAPPPAPAPYRPPGPRSPPLAPAPVTAPVAAAPPPPRLAAPVPPPHASSTSSPSPPLPTPPPPPLVPPPPGGALSDPPPGPWRDAARSLPRPSRAEIRAATALWQAHPGAPPDLVRGALSRLLGVGSFGSGSSDEGDDDGESEGGGGCTAAGGGRGGDRVAARQAWALAHLEGRPDPPRRRRRDRKGATAGRTGSPMSPPSLMPRIEVVAGRATLSPAPGGRTASPRALTPALSSAVEARPCPPPPMRFLIEIARMRLVSPGGVLEGLEVRWESHPEPVVLPD